MSEMKLETKKSDVSMDTKAEATPAKKTEIKTEKKPETKAEIKRLEHEYTVRTNSTATEDISLTNKDIKKTGEGNPLSNDEITAINDALNTNKWLEEVSANREELVALKGNTELLNQKIQSLTQAYLQKKGLELINEETLKDIVQEQSNFVINGINSDQPFNAMHGSGSGSLDAKFTRIFQDLKSGKWLAGDLNINLLEENVRKYLHSYLAKNKLAISEEGMDDLVKQQFILCKMRTKSIINPQQGKINSPDSFIKEFMGKLVDLETLAEEAPIALTKFAKSPMDTEFSRTDILKQTGGHPTYGFHDNTLYYITPGGQPAKIKGLDPKNEKDRVISSVFDDLQENEVVLNPSKLQLKVINELSGHKAHKDCISLKLIEKYESLAKINKQFMDEIKAIPKEKISAALISQIIKGKYPEIIDYYDPKRSYGHDHIALSAYEEVAEPQADGSVTTRKHVHISLNSMEADSISPSHFTKPITAETWNDYDAMFDALSTVVLREALRLLSTRTRVNKENKLTGKLEPQLYVFKAAKNFDALMAENILVDTFAGSCAIATNYSELLSLYQREIKDTSFPDLTEEQLKTYFNNIYGSEAFNRINNLKQAPATTDEKGRYNTLKALDAAELSADEVAELEVLENKVLKSRFENAFEGICKIITPANMDKEFRKNFGKAQNCVFARTTDLKIPGQTPGLVDNTLCPMTSGFDPLKQADGNLFSGEEHKQMQIQFMKNYIYRQHLLHRDADIDFALVEAGGQTEKKEMLKDTLNIINAFVLAGANATVAQKKAYYELMLEFDATLPVHDLCLGNENERKAESEDLAKTQEMLRTVARVFLSSLEVAIASATANESKVEAGSAVEAEMSEEGDEADAAYEGDVANEGDDLDFLAEVPPLVTIHTGAASEEPKLKAPSIAQGGFAYAAEANSGTRVSKLKNLFEPQGKDHFSPAPGSSND